MRLKQTLLVVLTLFLALGVLHAQEFRATISGHVYDSSGAAVPAAKVQAINIATNETTTATTEAAGTYMIPFLRPGVYRLTATAQGFKQYVRENVTLQVSQAAGIDITLQVGELTESVEVTAEVALLETQSASRGGVVTQQQVTEIPLNARNPFMLGAMMPGVTFNGAAIWQRPFDNGAIAEWSINGSRTRRNEFLLDGVPNNGQAGDNNIAYVPIVDAVQEFNIQTNSYNAEYGHTGGGIFNVVLKSGTQNFHGTAYEFMRRTPLDANRFQSNAVGSKRTTHYLDQYGGQLEGPLWIPKLLPKDSNVKLFFLGSVELYREGTPTPLTMSFPEPELRTGDFSKMKNETGQAVTIYDPLNITYDSANNPIRKPFANNRIPESLINPVAKAVTGYMPLPNVQTPPNQRYSRNNLSFPDYFAKDSYYNLILKFDWNFGDKHRAFIRHGSNDRTEDRNDNGVFEGPGESGQQPFQRINDAYAADWVTTISPTFIVNFRAGYNRFIEKGWGRGNEGFDLTKLKLPSALISTLPGPTFFGRWCQDGYSCLGRYQSINITNNYSVNGNITKIAGSHTIKAGIDVRRIHYITQNSGDILSFQGNTSWTRKDWNQSDNVTGDGYASFLLGISGGSTNYPLYPFWRNWYLSPFLQDKWQVSRKLTLDFGLRYDLNFIPNEKWNRMNGPFDLKAANPVSGMISPANLALYPQLANLKGSMTFAGVGGIASRPINVYKKTLQPRFGMAYQLTSKLVMRGGIGEYFLNPGNESLKTQGFSTSTSITTSIDGGRTPIPGLLSNPFPLGINLPAGSSRGALSEVGRNPNWYNSDFKLPNIWQFSFGFQYQVTQTSTLDFSYVGSRTYNGESNRNTNLYSLEQRKLCNPLEGGNVAYCDAGIPNPFKGIEAFRGQSVYTANTVGRTQMWRPMPQFTGGVEMQGANDSEIYYNSLAVTYNMRLKRGLNIMTNYTFSKQIERWGWTDEYARIKQQGLYFLDRPHAFKLTAIYELPFGKGKSIASNASGLLDRLIGGWEWTTFFTDASGFPNDLPGNVFQLKDPRVDQVDWKAYQVRAWSPCVLRMYNDGSVRPQQYSLDKGCGTDPSNYAWMMLPSYAPRSTPSRSGQIRRHHAFTMDASILKMTNITERVKLQVGVEAFNLMNHNYFGRENFNTDPNNANFGTIFPANASTQNIFPRQLQIRMKAYW